MRFLAHRFSFYVFSFFIPKIIRNRPLKILGLLKITTFIKSLRIYLAQKPRIITQIARTATRKRVGQKQLTSKPTAKVIPIIPLFEHFFLICLTLRYYIISKIRLNVTKGIKIYLKLKIYLYKFVIVSALSLILSIKPKGFKTLILSP